MEIKIILKKLDEYILDRQAYNIKIANNKRLWKSYFEDKNKSSWLVNSLMNKHADMMDNIPSPIVLPRFENDVAVADSLSKILSMILRQNNYEELYSDACWDKLKYGSSVQGVFWDKDKSFGMGDIVIKNIDLKNLYFSINVSNIEDSPFVFYISYMDKDEFTKKYKSKSEEKSVLNKLNDKVEIIDCYYKKKVGKRNVLHIIKLNGEKLLYSSEDDPLYKNRGIYAHAKYPFIIDSIIKSDSGALSYSMMDVVKNTQEDIDNISKIIKQHAKLASQKRYFVRVDGGLNESEFTDESAAIIHVAGSLGEDSIRQLELSPIDSACYSLLNQKIMELKECSGNRDVNQGFINGGVTAASAISALQEAGNKLSRDIIKSSYRSFTNMCTLIIELIREFYTYPRSINIIKGSFCEFMTFSNKNMQDSIVNGIYRHPEYDIIVTAQKASPFSTLAQNELAKEFYSLGFFSPENAKSAIACISMMNFDGKEELIHNIQKNADEYSMETSIQASDIPKQIGI